MSTVSGLMSGGAPLIIGYQPDETLLAGELTYASAAAESGLAGIGTAGTAEVQFVGTALNGVTKTTTQGTGANSAAVICRVVTNPDQMIRARMSGNSTTGTDLGVATVTTANSGGTSVTDTAVTFTNYTGGTIWGITGANTGEVRAITTTGGSNVATVEIPFDRDNAVGDTYGYTALRAASITNDPVFTTNFLELDAQGSEDTDSQHLGILYMDLNGVSDSYVVMVPRDSMFSNLG